jgi:biotin operon repressor
MAKAKKPFIEVVYKALTKTPKSGTQIAAKLGYSKSPARVRQSLQMLAKAGRAIHDGSFKSSTWRRA